MPPKKVKKVMTQPINVIFSHLTVSIESLALYLFYLHILSNDALFLYRPVQYIQSKSRVKIWLYEDTRMALEGQIIGFDEYMNMTLDDAVELDTKTGKRRDIGRILLKGDNITVIQDANPRPTSMEVME